MSTRSNFPFPGFILTTKPQFEFYCMSHAGVLDTRYQLEMKLASENDVVIPGVCPITLRRTNFRSSVLGGERLPGGRILPTWRYRQICDQGLPLGDRAAAHYALYNRAQKGLGKVLYISDVDALSRVLEHKCDSVRRVDFSEVDNIDERYDTILVINKIEQQENLHSALLKLNELLAEGGTINFHVNFHYFDDVSSMRENQESTYWGIGWDFLERLTAARFSLAHAITFWAQEIGYLGPYNFIFQASK